MWLRMHRSGMDSLYHGFPLRLFRGWGTCFRWLSYFFCLRRRMMNLWLRVVDWMMHQFTVRVVIIGFVRLRVV